MDDLITWLRAQLDEDERVARAAAGDGVSWRSSDGSIYPSNVSEHPGPIVTGVYGDLDDGHAEHIARWDPARVLAEVEAKRRVLDVLRGFEPNDEWATQPDMGQRANNAAGALRALAQPYAGRPGWREEWSATR